MKAKLKIVWVFLCLWPAAALAQSEALMEAFNKSSALEQEGRYAEAAIYALKALKFSEEEFGPDDVT